MSQPLTTNRIDALLSAKAARSLDADTSAVLTVLYNTLNVKSAGYAVASAKMQDGKLAADVIREALEHIRVYAIPFRERWTVDEFVSEVERQSRLTPEGGLEPTQQSTEEA
jgi:hypothetical protein